MKTSLIVTTYNRPDALALCLESIFRQRVLPDEIIVGDDGSRNDTAELVERYRRISPVPLIHVWQEDDGFRLAMIRNKCIARARYDYIIQIDGDLILHDRFVEDHRRFAETGYYVRGSRVYIERGLTEKSCKNPDPAAVSTPWFTTPGISRRLNAFRWPALAGYLAGHRNTKNPALGANMAYWRDDAIRINGFDEAFTGWGGEDDDFAVRMLNSGVRKKHVTFACIIFHLWHGHPYMDNKEKNRARVDESRTDKAIRCELGVDRYIPQS
ncbi:MAG: glycosyltransferase family 2 protein [Alistipes sp.]|nr:glycosyltransferase family 2 protein [Alistipes sp.]